MILIRKLVRSSNWNYFNTYKIHCFFVSLLYRKSHKNAVEGDIKEFPVIKLWVYCKPAILLIGFDGNPIQQSYFMYFGGGCWEKHSECLWVCWAIINEEILRKKHFFTNFLSIIRHMFLYWTFTVFALIMHSVICV